MICFSTMILVADLLKDENEQTNTRIPFIWFPSKIKEIFSKRILFAWSWMKPYTTDIPYWSISVYPSREKNSNTICYFRRSILDYYKSFEFSGSFFQKSMICRTSFVLLSWTTSSINLSSKWIRGINVTSELQREHPFCPKINYRLSILSYFSW